MKIKMVLFGMLFLHNDVIGMEQQIEMPIRVEQRENISADGDQIIKLAKQLKKMAKKISQLERSQKTCQYKTLVFLSVVGSLSSTAGLLLYIASWYYQFK